MNKLYAGKRRVENEKTDGFKFAVTAITALGTFLYVVVKYIQNTAVADDWYVYVLFIIPVIIISFICFIIYVVIKGFSVEMQDSIKNKGKGFAASIIYLSAFFMTVIILILVLSFIFLAKNPGLGYYFIILFYFIIECLLLKKFLQEDPDKIRRWKYRTLYFLGKIKKWIYRFHIIERLVNQGTLILSKTKNWIYGDTLILMFLIFILLGLSLIFLKPENTIATALEFISFIVVLIGILLYVYIIPKKYFHWLLFLVSSLILVSIFLWLVSISTFSYFTKGDIAIDMDMIYNKSSAPIPLSIKVTGPNTNLSIYLYEENETNLTPFDYIDDLSPNHNPNMTLSHNGSLIGNSLENGKYNVFIDTTKLSKGYHELVVKNIKYGKMDIKGFYLLNASER